MNPQEKQSLGQPKMMPDMTKRARISPVRHVKQSPSQGQRMKIDNTLTPLNFQKDQGLEHQRALSIATATHKSMMFSPDKKDKKSPNLTNIG